MRSPYVFMFINTYILQVFTNPYTIINFIGSGPWRRLTMGWSYLDNYLETLVGPHVFEDAYTSYSRFSRLDIDSIYCP